MNILEAFDLTRSFRDAGELVGCSHHTVADWVAKRDRGELPVPGEVVERPKLIDVHLPKIEEWVERSKGKIRADVVFERLEAVGFEGSARTVRRAVARLLIAHPPSSNRVRIRPALRRVPTQASETTWWQTCSRRIWSQRHRRSGWLRASLCTSAKTKSATS